jgi:hypothetical protein
MMTRSNVTPIIPFHSTPDIFNYSNSCLLLLLLLRLLCCSFISSSQSHLFHRSVVFFAVLQQCSMKFVFRSWSEFFEFSSFGVPSNVQKLIDRSNTNLAYFFANYTAFLVLGLFYISYHHTSYLFIFALFGGGLYFLMNYKKPIVINNRPITKREVILAYVSLFLLISTFVSGLRFLYVNLVALIFIAVHSIFRQPSLKSRGLTFLSELTGKSHVDSLDNPLADSPSNSTDAEVGSQYKQNQDAFRQQFRNQMRNKYMTQDTY